MLSSLAPGGPRIGVVIRNVVWVGIVAHTGFIPLFAWLGYPALAAFNVLSVALWLGAAIANRRGHVTPAMWLIVAEVVGHAALAVMSLGWGSGFQHYLIPLIPFLMFNERLSTRVVTLGSAGILATFAALYGLSPSAALDPRLVVPVAYANMLVPFLALGLVSYYFRLASTGAERRMARIALTDALTGLCNRRHMGERLNEERTCFERTGQAFSVILADIDRFKHINDTHGHAVGDKVLVAVAKLFSDALRGQDLVARWGGEEFLVLLAATGLERAERVAHRLREAAHANLSGLVGDGNVTLTFGVSMYEADSSVDGCVKAADEALYRGKAAGRDRVVVHPCRPAATFA